MSKEVDVNSLVEALGDAVIVCDREGAITFWNPAAERVFGFSRDEAIGQRLDLITPERLRQRHWDGFDRSMRTGKTRYGADTLRVPAINKNGDQLSIAFTIGLLHGDNGDISGIAAVIRDDTKRWTEERDLKRRVADLESAARASQASPPPREQS